MSSEILELDRMFNKVLEAFNCSICLGELKNVFTTTKCMHRFCEDCIKNCINEFQKCPLCNHYLEMTDIVKDPQYNSLKSEIEALRQIKMDQIYHRLTSTENQLKDKSLESPLEEVLKKHLIRNIQTHQNYTNQLQDHYFQESKNLEQQTKEKLLLLVDFNEIQKLNEEHNEKIESLKMEFNKQIQLITNHYDKFLENIKLEPLSLPIKLRIKLMNKKLQIDGCILKANDNFDQIFKFLMNATEKSNPIVQFGTDLTILCFGPFSKRNFDEVIQVYEDYITEGELGHGVQKLNVNSYPILEYSLKSGSEIAIFGTIIFEDDLPKQCYKQIFDKNNPKPIDYFTCKTCDNLNWICKSCIEVCHKDHQIKSFSLSHKPNWNCCYCERKNCSLK